MGVYLHMRLKRGRRSHRAPEYREPFRCQKAPDFARHSVSASGPETVTPRVVGLLLPAGRNLNGCGTCHKRKGELALLLGGGAVYAEFSMDVVALQEKISRIDGVEAARVVAGNGHIDEIHVLARRNKPPKQLVRDVQSLGQALFGVDIDRRIVSVVQLADSVLASGSRPALADVAESIDGNRTEVTVTLKWKERLLVGQATGAAAVATRWRHIAEATLEAVRQAIHSDVGLGVSSMDITTLGSRRLAISQVVVVTESGERLLIGSAYVEDDESRAVVRSVLDALNRLLPDLKTP